MSAQPTRHLRVVEVDDTTGEINYLDSEGLAKLEQERDKLAADLKQAERDLRAKRRRIAELEADKVRERLEHPRYQDACRVARYWWLKCRGGNRRVNYRSPDRIDAVLALMDLEAIDKDERGKRRRRPQYGLHEFKAAVDGAHFDHFVSQRKNGSEQHFDDLELICRSAAKFEEFIARCPYEVVPLADVDPVRDNPGEGSKRGLPSAASIGGGSYGPVARGCGGFVGAEQAPGFVVRVRVGSRVAGAPAPVA